jgi:hypothetical protein
LQVQRGDHRRIIHPRRDGLFQAYHRHNSPFRQFIGKLAQYVPERVKRLGRKAGPKECPTGQGRLQFRNQLLPLHRTIADGDKQGKPLGALDTAPENI